MKNAAKYSIKAAARLSGLSPYVIRAWERRYHILTPQRTDTNRRVYSEADIEKLSLLSGAVKEGSTIGNVAHMSLEELKNLNADQSGPNAVREVKPDSDLKYTEYLDACLNSIKQYDSYSLESTLEKSSMDLGFDGLMNGLLIPLINKIGEDWYNGEVRIAQEHMASSVLAAFLKNLIQRYKVSPYAPEVLVCTPRGQMHELGSLLAALVAKSEGWNVISLGADLPAEEIAAAAIYSNARAVCLSMVYPDEDIIPNELKALGKALKEKTVIIGGRAAHFYKDLLDKEGFSLIEDFSRFREALAEMEKK